MSGPTSATFEDSDEDLVHGPVTRSRGKLLEKLGSLISLSNRSVTFADSKEKKSRTLTINFHRKSFTLWAPFPKDSKVSEIVAKY